MDYVYAKVVHGQTMKCKKDTAVLAIIATIVVSTFAVFVVVFIAEIIDYQENLEACRSKCTPYQGNIVGFDCVCSYIKEIE